MKKVFYTVDRIEGSYAVLEDNEENIINVEIINVKGDLKEGKVLYKKDDLYFIDEEETKKRNEEINNLLKGLWED
ncbi:DUF3006 domain-containing protein [Clostridium sartagoforme]|uniref:DUF3006 domain-containing protein n=1 Tax=Clostridium sartagoforme TaxID=84031 RepID=A0A4S2DGY0_9CLOT|nr:DUF3006 domain-containing protein [Clostridium sartagoforme]TGY41347.1 DUF3006 domain-containing protein [Clostridium sartagoforme]